MDNHTGRADILAKACPGCMIKLKDGVLLNGSDTGVFHVVELLSWQRSKPKRPNQNS